MLCSRVSRLTGLVLPQQGNEPWEALTLLYPTPSPNILSAARLTVKVSIHLLH